MSVNHPRPGPDLVAESKNVEVKTGLSDSNWTLLGGQEKYGLNGKTCYLAGLVHRIERSVKEIPSRISDAALESLVTFREVDILGWEYVKGLEMRQRKTGIYGYIRRDDFPPITGTIRLRKGVIFFRDVDPGVFGLKY